MADYQTLNAAADEVSTLTRGVVDFLVINGAYQDAQLSTLAPSGFVGKEDVLRKDMVTSLEVNVLGTAFSINAFLPLLKKSSIKKVIAMSTGLADHVSLLNSGLSNFVTSSAIKAALKLVVV